MEEAENEKYLSKTVHVESKTIEEVPQNEDVGKLNRELLYEYKHAQSKG